MAIVDGCRTPFARSGTAFRDLSAIDLGKIAVRELLARTELDPDHVDHVIYGTVIPSPFAPNIAREVALGAGVPSRVPAFTVSRACASANQAITSAAEAIALGQADVVIAGGAESLTDVPVLVSRRLRDILVQLQRAKSMADRLRLLTQLRPADLKPVAPAIAEPSTGLTMGQSAEKMAQENGISREEQDRWALRSHRLAWAATEDGRLKEDIVPVWIPPDFQQVLDADNGIRPDTSLEKLAQLPPVFDRKYGTITAGNASPLTDGASALLLMSEDRARALGYRPLGYLRSYAYAALDPGDQLLQGPVFAVPKALERAGLSMADIALMEMHEAFAAQVLSNLQWMRSDRIAQERLGLSKAIGTPPEDRINVMGGSIAIGHPFGATGGRVVLQLLRELRRRGEQFGLVTVCAAGAMGVAMVLEAA